MTRATPDAGDLQRHRRGRRPSCAAITARRAARLSARGCHFGSTRFVRSHQASTPSPQRWAWLLTTLSFGSSPLLGLGASSDCGSLPGQYPNRLGRPNLLERGSARALRAGGLWPLRRGDVALRMGRTLWSSADSRGGCPVRADPCLSVGYCSERLRLLLRSSAEPYTKPGCRADLVGKFEAGIPRGRPSEPRVIADLSRHRG